MPVVIFKDADFVCKNMRQIEYISQAFEKTIGNKKSYIPLNVNNGRITLPYRTDSEIGTFSGISFKATDFRAMLVKGSSFDKERFFNDIRTDAERELAFYEILKKTYPDDFKRYLARYDLATYVGDEDRFVGSVDEVRERLFYWNVVMSSHSIRDSAIVLNDGTWIESAFTSGSRVDNIVEFGKRVEEVFNNLDSDDWLAVFDISE